MGLQWNDERFISELVKASGAGGVKVFLQIRDWALDLSLSPWYGTGQKEGNWYPGSPSMWKKCHLFSVLTTGQLEFWFGELRGVPPFDDRNKRVEILRRLNRIPGITIPGEGADGYPRIPLERLAQTRTLEQFLAVFDWVIDEIRRYEGRAAQSER